MAIVSAFSYPEDKSKLIKNVKKAAERENVSLSELIVTLLEKWHLEHAKSQNPQTKVTLFLNENAMAIPNAYASPEAWYKFYEILKNDKSAFLELDKQLQMIMRIHESFATTYGLRLCKTF